MKKNKPTILVLHGPNLNMLGLREPEIYGSASLKEINAGLVELAGKLGLVVVSFQSNHEGALVDNIQAARGTCQGLIINPAAYTHTSVAIRDALLLLDVPVIEVHLSNIYKRESFRRTSLISDVVSASLCGFGREGYFLALSAMAKMLAIKKP
jgi:3-dehydroquinate dehydratase-2